ncbi:MAG: hypothetical protein F6K14_22370 [Symploca sp. SIO2C1]|nr:hypothetical protein [Symploca sp. SIO2C1]
MWGNQEMRGLVEANTKLTQGDIIFDCPVVCWASKPLEPETGKEVEMLKSAIEVIRADVVVMTQACDLENNKVENVILCPHLSLEEYKEEWEKFMKERGQTKLSRAWIRTCEDIKNGYIWNLAMLNEGSTEELSLTHRVVDFQNVYTLPRIFLESLLQKRGKLRFRLRPPYREHLSQAFARFFMRVGLPMGVTKDW